MASKEYIGLDRLEEVLTLLYGKLSPILDTVTDVEDVTDLPADAAQHPTTLYLIKES